MLLDETKQLLDGFLDPVFRSEARSKPEPDQACHASYLIRQYMAVVLHRSVVVPLNFRHNLIHGLRALNHSEAQLLLKPERGSGWYRNYTAKIMKCYAVLHVN